MHQSQLSYVSSLNTVSLTHKPALSLLLVMCSLCLAPASLAQDGSRWFQIELSIFSNESPVDRDEERWQADRTALAYPEKLRQLDQLSELLLIEQLKLPPLEATTEAANNPVEELTQEQINREITLATGPTALRSTATSAPFRFYDLNRDSFLQLPASASNFQQTNQALGRSADHRLLFHGLWRQPLVGQAAAMPLYIHGGLQYGEQHELQGSITLRFNDNADRVVVDANFWLTEFSTLTAPKNDWQLPAIPATVDIQIESAPASSDGLEYTAARVFQFKQSRDMRSTEFHYLDHPAMGLVIMVEPYDVPAMPPVEADF